MALIDHRSVIPLYYQLAQILREQIRTTELPAGHLLPSERELIEQFGVGRGVIREALRALEATGFVTMRQGPNGGAFLKELNFNHLTGGFVDLYLAGKLTIPELERLGFKPEDTYLSFENRMKCGIGKCGRCNIGSRYVWVDGPVFPLAEVRTLPGEY